MMSVFRLSGPVLALVLLAGCGGSMSHYVPGPVTSQTSQDSVATLPASNAVQTQGGQLAAQAVAKAAPVSMPVISYFTGQAWNYTLCAEKTSQGYFQVSYLGHNSGAAKIVAHGVNLGSISSVTTSAPGYSVSVASVSATAVTLDLRAAVGEQPGPTANVPLMFTYANGLRFSPIVRLSVIPTVAVDELTWGQCTWYAGGIARFMHGQQPVLSYGQGVPLSGNPASAGFPTVRSVLMARSSLNRTKHMAYLESISFVRQDVNRDGSVTYTWSLSGSQYNIHCDGTRSMFNGVIMKTQRSKSGVYSVVQPPVVGYTIDAVAQ